MKYRYIAIEGTIGSGKTALAKRLTDYFQAKFIPEEAERNPFLIPFYLNAHNHGLATQLYFLLERSETALEIAGHIQRNSMIISDFLLQKDQIFAPVILDSQEQQLYWRTREKIMPHIVQPDLLIYLQCTNEQASKRLSTREEQQQYIFPEGYLKQVEEEYSRFFHLYDNAPVLIVNTDEIDFENNDEHFELLIKTLGDMRGKRCYLNLSES